MVSESRIATWFQTIDAYEFYVSLPDIMIPFVVAVNREEEEPKLKGLVVGYITKEKSPIKQFFMRRGIIMGGPLLAEDITDKELQLLLQGVVQKIGKETIYIEIRNFNDYSSWKPIFEWCGFEYQQHLNFHIDTTSQLAIDTNLGKGKKRDIKTTIREGAQIVTTPSLEQVREYYGILWNLYKTKVKTPLFSWEFFEQLYKINLAHFILVVLQGRVIGGTICVELEGRCLYEWYVCGMDGVYKSVFPSSYATYAGLCYAAEHGCPVFDMMGAGTPDEHYGVRDFKARFGGKLVENGRYLLISKRTLYIIGKIGVKIMKML